MVVSHHRRRGGGRKAGSSNTSTTPGTPTVTTSYVFSQLCQSMQIRAISTSLPPPTLFAPLVTTTTIKEHEDSQDFEYSQPTDFNPTKVTKWTRYTGCSKWVHIVGVKAEMGKQLKVMQEILMSAFAKRWMTREQHRWWPQKLNHRQRGDRLRNWNVDKCIIDVTDYGTAGHLGSAWPVVDDGEVQIIIGEHAQLKWWWGFWVWCNYLCFA